MSEQPISYKTKQRKQILAFLSENQEIHLTAQEVCDRLSQAGIQVGKATVYRTLNKLAAEGILRKFAAQKGDAACFEYIEGEHICQSYHLKCVHCGELIHLDCDRVTGFQEHLFQEHGFQVDRAKTVFYGSCAACIRIGK